MNFDSKEIVGTYLEQTHVRIQSVEIIASTNANIIELYTDDQNTSANLYINHYIQHKTEKI